MDVVILPFLAVMAGIVSFSSPCCLPLLPGYVSYVSGLPIGEFGAARARAVVLRASLFFVAGFTAAFTALGVLAGLLGAVLVRQLPTVTRISGIAVIALGVASLGVVRVPLLDRERRVDLAKVRRGPSSAFVLGLAFAIGWAPCIGPVLATVLATAAASETAGWGGVLLALYSLGLGVPFIMLALGLTRARGSVGWLRRHSQLIERLGGMMMIAVGVLFVTGEWRQFFLPLQRTFARWGWPPI
jgi:cytochrome c-type biogenesis protein